MFALCALMMCVLPLVAQESLVDENVDSIKVAYVPQKFADNWEISDYGFMIVKENTLVNTYKEETVEDAYFHNKRLQNLHKQDGDTPFTDESNYLFSVILNAQLIGQSSSS